MFLMIYKENKRKGGHECMRNMSVFSLFRFFVQAEESAYFKILFI